MPMEDCQSDTTKMLRKRHSIVYAILIVLMAHMKIFPRPEHAMVHRHSKTLNLVLIWERDRVELGFLIDRKL